MSNFRVGDSVVVAPGTLCPDKQSISIAGWQGRITEVIADANTLDIAWDSQTLRAMSDDYIRECEIEGFGWDTMVLEEAEVLPARPRDTVWNVAAARKAIVGHHQWDHLSDENPGIAELLGPLGNASDTVYLRAWKKHLSKALTLPFNARVEEELVSGPVRVGSIVQMLSLLDDDEDYGLIASVIAGRNPEVLPLCDLEEANKSSKNYLPLRDYVVWFANR